MSMYSLNTDSALEPSRTTSHVTVTITRLLQTLILILFILFILSPLAEERSSTGARGFRGEEKMFLFFFFNDQFRSFP